MRLGGDERAAGGIRGACCAPFLAVRQDFPAADEVLEAVGVVDPPRFGGYALGGIRETVERFVAERGDELVEVAGAVVVNRVRRGQGAAVGVPSLEEGRMFGPARFALALANLFLLGFFVDGSMFLVLVVNL